MINFETYENLEEYIAFFPSKELAFKFLLNEDPNFTYVFIPLKGVIEVDFDEIDSFIDNEPIKGFFEKVMNGDVDDWYSNSEYDRGIVRYYLDDENEKTIRELLGNEDDDLEDLLEEDGDMIDEIKMALGAAMNQSSLDAEVNHYQMEIKGLLEELGDQVELDWSERIFRITFDLVKSLGVGIFEEDFYEAVLKCYDFNCTISQLIYEGYLDKPRYISGGGYSPSPDKENFNQDLEWRLDELKP